MARHTDRLDLWQQAKFVDLLRGGQERWLAARAVGSTASRFRALEKRDEPFARLVEEATGIGGLVYQDKLRHTHRTAVDNPKHPNHWRAVERESDALLPEYEHKRTTRVGNAAGEVLAVGAVSRITPEALAALPQDVLEKLIEAAEIERAIAEGHPPTLRAIEGGE